MDNKANRRLTWIVIASGVVILLAYCGSRQADDGFQRFSVDHNLKKPETFLVDPQAVTASPLAPCQWADGTRLAVKLMDLAPGHLIRLKLRSSEGAVPLRVRSGGKDLASFTVTTEWQQYELVAANDSPLLVLFRVSNQEEPIHIARISHANTIGRAGPPVTGWLLSKRLQHQPRPMGLRGIVFAVWCILLLAATSAWFALVLRWQRTRAMAVAVLALVPAGVLLIGFEIARLAAGNRLVYPSTSFVILTGMVPCAIIGASGVRLLLARWRQGLANLEIGVASHSWPPLRRGLGLVTWVGLGGLALILMALLPRSPFEWDEVLFARSLDDFDVARHRPHPPGYPVFLAAGAVLRLIVGDPIRSLQLVSVAASILCLLFTMKLMRRLEAPPVPAGLTAVLLACIPAFAFYANVGLSDMTGTATAVIAAWALARVIESPESTRWLVAASLLCAVAMGVRPQLALVLCGPGLLALLPVVQQKRWRSLGLAVVTGVVTSATCWLPPILLTGLSRYFSAAEVMGSYMAQREAGGRLPGVGLAEAVDGWLLRPLGPTELAVVMWLSAAAGAVIWWRHGQRRLVLVAGLAVAGHLLVSPWLLQAGTAVRYVLPALPFAMILASGVILVHWRRLRLPALVLLLSVAAAMVLWTAPAILLRASEKAPVWAALEWTRDFTDPTSTVVVHDGEITPHAQYVLSPAGFECHSAEEYRALRSRPAHKPVWIISPAHGATAALFEARWQEDRIAHLTRRRYRSCAVRSTGDVPVLNLSAQWSGEAHRRRLESVGRLWVDHATRSTTIELGLADGTAEVRRGAEGCLTLEPETRAFLPVGLGKHPALRVGPQSSHITLGPVRLAAPPAIETRQTMWIQAVDHRMATYSTRWRSDLELRNPLEEAIQCRLVYVPAGKADRPTATLRLPASTTTTITDLVPTLFGASGTGALRIETGAPGIEISSQMLLLAPGEESASQLEPLAADQALNVERPGIIHLSARFVRRASALSLGLVNAGERRAEVHVTIRTMKGKPVFRLQQTVAAQSCATRKLSRRKLAAAEDDLVLTIRSNGRKKPVFAHMVVAYSNPRTTWHFLPATATAPAP